MAEAAWQMLNGVMKDRLDARLVGAEMQARCVSSESEAQGKMWTTQVRNLHLGVLR